MALGLVRWILYTLRGTFKLRESILFRLPAEILFQILSHLSLPSKVCLALSCKSMYNLLSPVFKESELQFPRMPRVRFEDKLPSTRARTLIQLRNSRWLFCAACQKLHPINEISDYQKQNVSPWQRRCRPWSGIVDLCPCIAITPRDRAHIVEYLMRKRQRLDLVEKGLLQIGEKCNLLHRCNAYSTVQANVTLSLAEYDKLIASVKYRFHHSTLSKNMEWAQFCCSCDLWDWLGCRLRTRSIDECFLCHTRGYEIENSHDPEFISARATRDLGRGLYPTDVINDDQWYVQGRPAIHLYD